MLIFRYTKSDLPLKFSLQGIFFNKGFIFNYVGEMQRDMHVGVRRREKSVSDAQVLDSLTSVVAGIRILVLWKSGKHSKGFYACCAAGPMASFTQGVNLA